MADKAKSAAGKLGAAAANRKGAEFRSERASRGGIAIRMMHGSSYYGHLVRLRWAKQR